MLGGHGEEVRDPVQNAGALQRVREEAPGRSLDLIIPERKRLAGLGARLATQTVESS